MAHQRLISLMERNSIEPNKFNHFDYVDMIEQLSELELLNHPRKRKLVEQFASRCLQKLHEDQKLVENKEKVNNFLKRVVTHQQIKKQRLQALMFLEHKYDSRCKQLKFYPKINSNKATQRNRYWKDIDGFQKVSEQQSIYRPNIASFEEHSQYSSISN